MLDAPSPLLQRYAEVCREVMLRYMPVNSCIAATRITCDCLKRMGFSAEPVPVKFVVTLPTLNRIYSSGLSEAELATALEVIDSKWGKGWRGHLIARVNRTWLVDASFDQAQSSLELPVEHVALVTPLSARASDSFHVTYNFILRDRRKMKVEYVTTDDESYREAESWNDKNLSLIVDQIMRKISGVEG